MQTRERIPELMDDPQLDRSQHKRALRGLARLNALTNAHWLLWRPIRRLANSLGRKDLRVLDIATGSADNAINLWELAKRAGYSIQVDGCDLSPIAIAAANKRAEEMKAPSKFFLHDAIADEIPHGYDVVMCSLFTHHLEPEQTVAFLARMKEATGHLVLVNDLIRSYASLAMVTAATRLVTRSPVVHFDGPASVRNSYKPGEFRELAQQADLEGAVVHEVFPCRMLLVWNKTK